jgi:formamidopyrimidine-DNA glycosylase
MPELPEVETVKRGLEPALVGQVIAKVSLRRANLRFAFPPDFVGRIEGAKVTGLYRRAKYILATLDQGDTLLMHLGMTGRFTVLTPDGRHSAPGEFYDDTVAHSTADGPHDHVVFTLQNGTRIVYSDPRRFGMMDLERAGETHALLKDIGVEPLGNALDAAYLQQRFDGKSAPLKAALLDQRIIAGLGNIYVCEALFRTGLLPTRKAGTLVRGKKTDPRLENLVRHIRDILNEAILAGGSTLQDYQSVNGTKGAYQQRFSVYDREDEPCVTAGCNSMVKRLVQSGRSTFYCSTCQK